MDEPQKRSYKLAWIAAVSFIVLLLIIIVTVAVVMRTTSDNQKKTATTSTTAANAIPTKSEVQKQFDAINAGMKQAAAEQAAAKAALNDKPNTIKVNP